MFPSSPLPLAYPHISLLPSSFPSVTSEYPYLKQVDHPVDPGLDVGKLGDLWEAPLSDPPAVCEGRREPERLHKPGREKTGRRKAGRQDSEKTRGLEDERTEDERARGRESTRTRRRRSEYNVNATLYDAVSALTPRQTLSIQRDDVGLFILPPRTTSRQRRRVERR